MSRVRSIIRLFRERITVNISKKTFSSNENTLGAIFLNVDNQKDFTDKNSVIYGHRMRDGSMFRHLQDYDTREFWKNNPYFYIYTVDGRILKYHIYSAGQVVDTSESYQTTFETDEEYQEFLNMTQSTSLYNTGVEVRQRKMHRYIVTSTAQ